MATPAERAKGLLAEHRREWSFWTPRQRENFLRRCRRLAAQINPKDPGADALAVLALDTIQTRTGSRIWS